MKDSDFLEANKHIQFSNDLLKTIQEKHKGDDGVFLYAANNQLRYAGCCLGLGIQEYFKNVNHNQGSCSTYLEESRIHTYRARILATEAALENVLSTIENYMDNYLVDDLEKAGITSSQYFEKKRNATKLLETLSKIDDKNVTRELADNFSNSYSDLIACVNELAEKRDFLDKIKNDNTTVTIKDSTISNVIKYFIYAIFILLGLILQPLLKVIIP